jgi:hypothetical protein
MTGVDQLKPGQSTLNELALEAELRLAIVFGSHIARDVTKAALIKLGESSSLEQTFEIELSLVQILRPLLLVFF